MPVMHLLPTLNAAPLCGAQGALYASLTVTAVTCSACLRALEPEVSEAAMLGALRRVALAEGWSFYHTHDSRRSDPGFCDCVCAKPGHTLYIIELKTATGVVSVEQARWLEVLPQVTGVEAALVRPADFPAMLAKLRKNPR